VSDEMQASNRSDRRDVKLTNGDDFTSLRDRIAAVLSQQDVNLPDKVADAVIAELGLTVTGGVIVGCLHD